MKHHVLLAAVLAASFTAASAANVVGKSSNPNNVDPGASDILPFGAGDPGLSMKNFDTGVFSKSINLEKGPVQHILEKFDNTPINGSDVNADVDGNLNPKFLTMSDVNTVIGWFYNPTLGQVWYENRAYDTGVYSVRQIDEPAISFAPKFGGLVIGKVPHMSENNYVFFGEWAPRADNPSEDSDTNLNMDSEHRTVWYVGENPTGNTTGLSKTTYEVLGVNKHTPGQNDFYKGEVTAVFGSNAQGSMSGAISRNLNGVQDDLSFADVLIDNADGTFAGGAENIQGRFFGNQAAAMAGFAERGAGVGDDVAFGGHKKE